LNGLVEESLSAAIATTLKQPRPHPLSLPQFSAPVLARQYVALYRRLIASAAHAHKLRLRKQVTVAVSGRQL
jgi:hypothetical protein